MPSVIVGVPPFAGVSCVLGATTLSQRIAQLSVRPGVERVVANLAPSLGCAVCTAREYNLCEAAKIAEPLAESERTFIPQSSHTTKARRLIVHEQDFPDAVPIICSGWAASINLLPDGRRQIMSILLPGDIVSTGLLFGPKPKHVIEAITEIRYRTFKRCELKGLLFKRTDFLVVGI